MADVAKSASTTAVIILCFCLVGLILLLLFLYKKLNREANGEYTIQRLVYKEGGVRDRVRGVALALETRLGVQLWPRSEFDDEDGEEMQEVQDEERHVEEGSSEGSASEEDDQEEEEERSGEGEDDSDDNSSMEGSEAGENARLTYQQTAKEELVVEKEENDGNRECKGEASGGAGMLIDLKQFSGSVTWSDGGVCRDGDVTAL